MPLNEMKAISAALLLCNGVLASAEAGITNMRQVISHKKGYTTDAICRQKHCINPVFPGLQDLSLLEATTWQCQSGSAARKYMQFCGEVVSYDVAIQSPNMSTPLPDLVAAQEKAAATMYRYHLTAMNLEPWDYRKPAETLDDCVKSVWKMVCATYFPKAQAGCQAGQATPYLRPCSNVCQNYVTSCGVECCDESVMCVPTQEQVSMLGVADRYIDAAGPSAICTGAASRGSLAPGALLASLLALVLPHVEWSSESGRERPSSLRRAFVAAALGVMAMSLQGCSAVGHSASAWESKPSYFVNFQYMPLNNTVKQQSVWQAPADTAIQNSCELTGLPASRQCGSHGYCKQYGERKFDLQPLLFCECDRDWADPECRTRRKSQAAAFFLSLLGGPLGLDRFYLGDPNLAMLKMATLGGFGVWWLYDVARVGSTPVYAADYRVAADLPHWLYVMVVIGFFAAMGCAVFNLAGSEVHRRKEMAKLLQEAEEDWKRSVFGVKPINPTDRGAGMPSARDQPAYLQHSMPMPTPGVYGTMVPSAVISAAYSNPYSPYNVYNNAVGDPSLMSSVNAPPPQASPP